MKNSGKLHGELLAAGIQISGCNSDGKVWDVGGNEIQDRQDVAAVIAAHDPTPVVQAVQEFLIPIKAPDFIVASPKPKVDPAEALSEALSESKKAHGSWKSVPLMVLDLLVYIEELERRVKKLEGKNG